MIAYKNNFKLKLKKVTVVFIAFLFSGFITGQTVEVWLTTSDKANTLSQKNNLSFSSGNATGTIIDITKYIRYQTMDGFGASMTGSSGKNIQEMPEEKRETLMNDLFADSGIRLNFMRHTIGASDFSVEDYTYNDIPKGQVDPAVEKFSLHKEDLWYIIPPLQKALAINPSLRIMGSPWTAPAWMKDEYTLFGSRVKKEWYTAYANYFVKYVKAYKEKGIDIWGVTIQNEADFDPSYYPSTKWTAKEQGAFLKHLGPAFNNAALNTGIMVLDHNWDLTDFPISILNDSDAKKYTTGTAFHAYGGNVTAQTKVHNAHPDKGIWFTEITGITPRTDFLVEFRYFMKHITIDAVRNWAKGVLFWNLALDEKNGPQPHQGACSTCRGLVTINSLTGEVTKNVEYYALGHFSKFIDQGAIRIFSTETDASDVIDIGDEEILDDGISNVAFENPDGSIVVVVYNGLDANDPQKPISIRMGNQSFSYRIPPRSATTFKWTPDNQPITQPTAVKVYINNEEKLSIDDIADTNSYPATPIDAVLGDELILEVGRTDIDIPEIMGLPDLWFAQAFSREGIMMSSKSITPGAFKPWVPFGTTPHTTWVTTFPKKLYKPDELQSTKYPEWEIVDGKYQFKWTLQRTMDATLQYNGQTIDYTNKYPDEEVPWWQTWDENGNPIIDGTGKFNSDGSVPFGKHAKPDGKYPQRQGKFMGQSMQLLHAMKGTLKTAYGKNTAFSDDNPYTAKTDGDDVYSFTAKDPSSEPFNVVPPNDASPLYRPFVELWKVIPEGESNNPINDIVTWYQKTIHEDIGKSLPENYQYDGYEVWEDPVKNPSSKAPGKVMLSVNGSTLPLFLNVQSPFEEDKFYVLHKVDDDNTTQNLVLGTEELKIGIDKKVKADLVNQLQLNDSKFDLVLPFNSLNYAGSIFGSSSGALIEADTNFASDPNPVFGPKLPVFGPNPWPGHDDFGTIIPLTLNDDGTLSGDMIFDVAEHGKILPLQILLFYRRTPESEPVIISGQDFWYSSWVEAMKCLEYNNESESRSLTKFNFHITNFYEKQISLAEGLAHGLPITEKRRLNQEFVVMKGEKLTFSIWDDVDFAFKNRDTKWYVSSRKKLQQLEESVAAKRVRTKLYQYADNGVLMSETILQDFGQGNSLTVDHTFGTVGNYVFEASLRHKQSEYRVFVKVMEPEYYGNGHEGRVKVRNLLAREIDWVNATLADEKKINGNEYQLAMVTDLKSSYAWKQPKDGGGPRSFMKNDGSGEAKYIDRFAPYNDYADHYVYKIEGSGTKQTTQNIQAFQEYIKAREPYFKLLPGVWTNHMDPLGIGNAYGVQDEFNLENRIQDVTSSFIENAFTEVQKTKAHLYTVDFLDKETNSRSPREWEIKIPWGSYSKYHGFRLRDVPKAPVNAEKLKEAILIHMKTGSVVNKPMPQVKYGILDTEEDKLEYLFLLNLKHNRWVVTPKSVNNLTFYNGSDQDKIIASGFSSNTSELSGIHPVALDSKEYILVNREKKCLAPTNEEGNQIKWNTYTSVDGRTLKSECERVTISTFSNDPFNRFIKLGSNTKYLNVDDETFSLSIVSEKTAVTPYQLKNSEIDDGVYLGAINPERTKAITTSQYKFIEPTINFEPSTSNTTKHIIGSIVGGGLFTASLFGAKLFYGKYIRNRTNEYERFSNQEEYSDEEAVEVETRLCND